MTDEVPCPAARLPACAPELPKMNAVAVMMSAKPTHVISGRSENAEIASYATTPVAAIVRPADVMSAA